MSGQIPAVLSVGGIGAVVLPNTGSTRPLFYVAVSMLVVGLVAMIASAVIARRAKKAEAN